MLRYQSTRLAGPSRLVSSVTAAGAAAAGGQITPRTSQFSAPSPTATKTSTDTRSLRITPANQTRRYTSKSPFVHPQGKGQLLIPVPPWISLARIQNPLSPRYFSSTRLAGANFPFKLHDIGEGIAEVELVKWYVKEGDKVEEFDVLCEVQSDKSTVELTSPTVGVVRRLGADEGVVVKVGELICDIDTGGTGDVEVEQQNDIGPIASETTAPTINEAGSNESAPHAETPSQQLEEKEPGSEQDDSLFESRDTLLDTSSGAQFSGEAAMLPSPPARSEPIHEGTEAPPPPRKEREKWSEIRKIVKASPAVRTLAARMGVELSGVKGTGEGGRVVREDVVAASSSSLEPSSDMGMGMGLETRGVVDARRDEIPMTTRVEFGRTRKVMYRAMGDMGHVPHFGYSHTLNLTPLLPYIQSLSLHSQSSAGPEKRPYLANDIPPSLARDPLSPSPGGSGSGVDKTTLLSFLIKGLLLAMEEHPIMRSRVKTTAGGAGAGGGKEERWLEVSRDGIVAVAVSDPKFGLLTPSLPPLPPSTPLSSLTSQLAKLRLNASKPPPAGPGSITISSVGALGESKGAMPVLPPGGGVAIAAVGRAEWGLEWSLPKEKETGKGVFGWTKDQVEKGGMEAVLRCPVGWSGDHRVLEGAELIAFTETWKKYIEEPWRWIKVDG